jgi:hypothetical protein
MSVIKPRTRGKRFVKHTTRVDEVNQETLYAYAHMIDESTEYVLNQLIDTVLARDKEFVRWRVDHPQSCVPRPKVQRRPDAPCPEPTPAVRPLGTTGVRSVS